MTRPDTPPRPVTTRRTQLVLLVEEDDQDEGLSAHRPTIAGVSDWTTKRLLQYRTRGELLVDTFAVVGFFVIMVLFVRLVDW